MRKIRSRWVRFWLWALIITWGILIFGGHWMHGDVAGVGIGAAIGTATVLMITGFAYLLRFVCRETTRAVQPIPSYEQIAAELPQYLGRQPTLEEVILVRHEMERRRVTSAALVLGTLVGLHHFADVAQGRHGL